MTKRELEAEVERLRGEVALLRSMQAAHVCPLPAGPQCSCNLGLMPGTVPCPVHGIRIWKSTVPAAGCNPLPVNWCYNAAGQPSTIIEIAPSSVCAGAAAQPLLQTYWVNA